jgi:hypothetical protein
MAEAESPPLKAEKEKIEYATEGADLEQLDSGELITVDNTHGNVEVFHELPKEEADRILRKVDFRVVPLLSFLYLVSFVDRSNSRLHSALKDAKPLTLR